MLTASYYRPEENHLGDLGWPKFVRSAVGAVVDSVGDVITTTGSAFESIGRAAGNAWCDVTTHPAAQTAAALAALSPDPYAKGAAAGMAVNAAVCSAARGPGTPTTAPGQVPGQASGLLIRQAAVVSKKPKTIAQRLPPGSIQAQIPGTDKWAYAIPKGAVLTPLSGNGLGSSWSGRDFVSPSARSLDQRIRRQYSWYDVNTADQPYLVAWGMGAMELQPVVGEKSDKATIVDPKTLKNKTTPLIKKWWFWAAIVGGATALGTGGYLVYRRRK